MRWWVMKQLFRAVLGAVQEEVLRCLLFLLLLSSFQLVILIWRKFEDQSGVLAPRELPFFFFYLWLWCVSNVLCKGAHWRVQKPKRHVSDQFQAYQWHCLGTCLCFTIMGWVALICQFDWIPSLKSKFPEGCEASKHFSFFLSLFP